MGLWRSRETDLERELRAQRPQPREDFVRMLAHRSATPKIRRRMVPGIVVVAAVGVVLAASLGTAGALGAASHSVVTLCKGVGHIVEHPKSPPTYNNPNKGKGDGKGKGNGDYGGYGGNGGNGGSGGNGGNGNGGSDNGGNGNGGDDGDHHGHYPIHHQYKHHVPVCHKGNVEWVPVDESFYDFLHGYEPYSHCHHH